LQSFDIVLVEVGVAAVERALRSICSGISRASSTSMTR